MEQVKKFVELLGPRRLLAMAGVAVALLGVLGFVAYRGSGPEMAYLYTDLEPGAAQSVTEKLTAQNIPYEISADGTSILAPRDRLPELRMKLASEQVGAKIGYDVLDNEEPFGVSASRARMNETRAIEGELAKSINTLQNVLGARVHLVMPERKIFETQERKATAAVTVKTQGRLGSEEVNAIRYLVSSSVPALSPDNVSIVDQNGALLARAGEEGLGSSEIEEQQHAMEERLRTQVESLLEPIVGQGKVRAEIAVQLTRGAAREESETFNPDGQVIARQVTVESRDQSAETDPGAGAASVGAQLPESKAGGMGSQGGNARNAARNENSEDTTYQNSRAFKVTETAAGSVQRLTVAVMLDSVAKAVPQDKIQRLTRLVENAVGVDAERGDSVVIESMPFSVPTDPGALDDSLPLGLTADQILSILKLVVIGVIGLFVLRMLKGRLSTSKAGGATPALAAPGHGEIALIGAGAGQAHGSDGQPGHPQLTYASPNGEGTHLRQGIELAQADSAEKSSALDRVGQAVADNPAEAAALVRQWLNG